MRTPRLIRSLPPMGDGCSTRGYALAAALTWGRGQILLASGRGQPARLMAEQLGCDDPPVRTAMQAFQTAGLAAIQPRPSTPRHVPHAVCDAPRRER